MAGRTGRVPGPDGVGCARAIACGALSILAFAATFLLASWGSWGVHPRWLFETIPTLLGFLAFWSVIRVVGRLTESQG